MAFIDMVEWQPTDSEVYAWKFPHNNLSTFTQLIVRESQEAVFFSKGQILGKFGPGKHTLTTENLPLLRSLYGIPFGSKNPFTAEVWFVNKLMPLTIDWKTTPMRFMDPDYGQMIPLIATGRYGLKVNDAERFLVKLVGTMREFTKDQLTDHFLGPLIAKTNSSIISYMNTNRIGITQIAGYLDALSKFIELPLREFWEDYGFDLTGFFITSVDLDTSTVEGQKISEAFAERSAQNIAGYTWQQKQSFGVAGEALSSGGNIGILGAAMMTGMMGQNTGMGQAMMSPPQSYPQQNAPTQGYGMNGFGMNGMQGANTAPYGNARKEVFCSNCSKKYPITSKFCPHCGDAYNPCPMCGSDNASGARRCVTCGASLNPMSGQGGTEYAGTSCPRCKHVLEAGVKFCPNCGEKIF